MVTAPTYGTEKEVKSPQQPKEYFKAKTEAAPGWVASQAVSNLTNTSKQNRARMCIKTGRGNRCLTLDEVGVCERRFPHGAVAGGFGFRDVHLQG